MSENMKFEDTPAMEKVFAAAGIEPDENQNAGENNDTQTGTSTESGDTDKAKTSEEQGAAGQDSLSSKPDSGKKPGDKTEEKKVTGNPNDLTLPDGSVVKAGAERRHYETAQLAKQNERAVRNDLTREQTAHNELKTKYNSVVETVKQIGLEDPAAVSSAVRLYKDLSSDPIGTMTKLLAELKAKGHTFDGIGSAVDTAAITSLIDARLPAKVESTEELQHKTNSEIDHEVNQFLEDFPDAITQEVHIAALIDRAAAQGQVLPLRDAYTMLRNQVIKDGLDWSKPLGPQIEARKATQQAQTQTQQQERVSGRGGVNAGVSQTDPALSFIPERDDSDSIVRAAMKEQGYKV